MAVVGAGCGGSKEDPAAAAWHNRTGATWEKYEKGYKAGWANACSVALNIVISNLGSGGDAGLPSLPCVKVPSPRSVPEDPPPSKDAGVVGWVDGGLESCGVLFAKNARFRSMCEEEFQR
jgi:hypothetical protein